MPAVARRVRRRGRRGAGTVWFSKPEGRWIAKFPTGGGRDVRVRCHSQDEADYALNKLRRTYGRGGFSTTLDGWLDDWLPAHGRSIRPSTLVSYRQHVNDYISPLLGGIPMAQLGPSDVRRLVADLERRGKSAGTIHLVIRTLSAALNAAVAERVIPDNPARGVRLPRIEREPVRALTPDDADAILAALSADPKVEGSTDHWLLPVVRVLLGSGLRLGECLGLDQRDVGDGYVVVRRSKTRVRAVPVTDDAMDALRDAIRAAPRVGPGEPVFFAPRVNRAGTRDRMRGHSVSHALPRVLEAKGLPPLHPHLLRHGVASLMLAQGTPMRLISEQLGHATIRLTADLYSHVAPEAQRAAIRTLERRRAK